MRLISRPLPGMLVLQTEPRTDERGFFARCFCRHELAALGIASGVEQANLSFSVRAGTLRGLHYQMAPARRRRC
jgi:dTDP-4-dehydrorhamnose 3,5-epimerase